MSADDYHLYLRGPDLKRALDISDYSSLSLVPKFNDVGRWTLALPATSPALSVVGAGYGLIVEQDGVDDPVFSGDVDKITEVTDDKGTTTLNLTGPDDNVWLARRQALPCAPSGSTGTVYAGSDYDSRTGAGETVMRSYVNDSAIAVNPVSGLSLDTNLARGTAVSEQARFGTLLVLLQDIASHAGGLGFRIVQSGTGLAFKVYAPVDRSSTVIFSRAFGNLQSSTYQTQAPTCNHVIVAGGGELSARTFYEASDSASIAKWGRITLFVDQRQTTDSTQLQQAGDKALADGAEKSSLSIVPVDSIRTRYGRDYIVGDKGRVDPTPDTSIVDVIRSATITIKPNEDLIVKPVIGGPDAKDPTVPDFFKQRKDFAKRLAALESS